MKFDVYTHILPAKYKEALYKSAPSGFSVQRVVESIPTLYDLDHRFRIMDKFPGVMQVLTLSSPGVQEIGDGQKALDLAKIANDGMAELVRKYPDRFAAAVATVPMNNMDAALNELDRAVNELHLRGVQIDTPVNDKPLDSPEFMPLYEKMNQYNLPIWIHPTRTMAHADYKTEERSKYMIFHIFGWPYETTAAVTRLVFSGILDKYPELKFITHHAGGMIPFFEQRIIGAYDHAEMQMGRAQYRTKLRKAPIEYFKMFYGDTAIYGGTPGLMCAYAFFGSEHLLFGTDMPYDNQFGERYTRQTIESIEQMAIDQSEKKRIYEDNARKLLRLTV
jgi:uncharacterized protein